MKLKWALLCFNPHRSVIICIHNFNLKAPSSVCCTSTENVFRENSSYRSPNCLYSKSRECFSKETQSLFILWLWVINASFIHLLHALRKNDAQQKQSLLILRELCRRSPKGLRAILTAINSNYYLPTLHYTYSSSGHLGTIIVFIVWKPRFLLGVLKINCLFWTCTTILTHVRGFKVFPANWWNKKFFC